MEGITDQPSFESGRSSNDWMIGLNFRIVKNDLIKKIIIIQNSRTIIVIVNLFCIYIKVPV